MVLYGETEGGMNVLDLQTLIETRIPEHRTQMETSFNNLHDVANYLEGNYINSTNKDEAFKKTKNYAVQSLASVAYQINTMGRDLLDMLDLETEKISNISHQVNVIDQVVRIHKEKLARREVGALTTNKNIVKQPKIVAPAVQDTTPRYRRMPIDFSVLDSVGHGVRSAEPSRTGMVSRASSTISGSTPHYRDFNQYGSVNSGATGHYERTANINSTLGRASLRSGHMSMGGMSDYRVPQAVPSNSDYGTLQGGDFYGNGDYGYQDRYGTIRANGGGMTSGTGTMSTQHGGHHSQRPPLPPSMEPGTPSSGMSTMRLVGRSSTDSPVLPMPPPQLSQHYGGYVPPGTINGLSQRPLRINDLPPPPDQLLRSMHEDDDLPPPPPPAAVSNYAAVGSLGTTSSNSTLAGGRTSGGGPAPSITSMGTSNFFDTSSEWVPEGAYIEKALVLYDYDAEKADELTLRENSIVYVLRKNEDGWFEGVLDGVTGLFPGNYVQPISS